MVFGLMIVPYAPPLGDAVHHISEWPNWNTKHCPVSKRLFVQRQSHSPQKTRPIKSNLILPLCFPPMTELFPRFAFQKKILPQ